MQPTQPETPTGVSPASDGGVPVRRRAGRATALAIAAGLALALGPAGEGGWTGTASADTFELADGTVLDGKLIQEKDGQVWIRTFLETKQLPASDVKTRTPGVADADRYATLKSKVEKDPKDVASMWELYELLMKYAEASKPHAAEARLLPPRIVKVAPDHEQARDANGECRFEGKWVKKEDLARLQAEAARKAKIDEWQKKLGVTVDVYESEHFLFVDNTKCKELSKHAKMADEVYRLCGDALGVERFWDGQAPVVTLSRYADYLRLLDESWKTAWGKPQWWYDAAKHPGNGGLWLHKPTAYQMRTLPESKAEGEDGMWAAVVHNVAHVCIWTHRGSVNPPTWLEEGLASALETEVRGYPKAFCVGSSTDHRGKTSDQPKRGKAGNKEIGAEVQALKEHARRAMEDGEFPEMRKFLRMPLGEFGPAEVGGAVGLVQWLRGKDAEKFKELWKILRNPPKNDDEPWRKTYGWNLIEDMQKEFKVWVLTEW